MDKFFCPSPFNQKSFAFFFCIKYFFQIPSKHKIFSLKKMDINPVQNVDRLPSPCKDSPTAATDFYTKVYCYGLLSLWIMLMLSALIYQIRTIQPLIDRIPGIASGLGSIFQTLRSPLGWISLLFSSRQTSAPGVSSRRI